MHPARGASIPGHAMPRIAFVTPPLIKPAEPGLSAAAAARWFKERGVDARAIDGSIGWYRHALSPSRLEAALGQAEGLGYAGASLQAFRQAIRDLSAPVLPLRRPEVYGQRRTYSSAVSHLVNALRLASVPHPGFHLRVADVEVTGRRVHSSGDLYAMATAPSPFDDYFLEELIPQLEREGITHVALSLTFLNQAVGAFRLAHLLAERLPSARRLLGGPLMACWSAVGAPFDTPPFGLFHRVYAGLPQEDMGALAQELGAVLAPEEGVMAPELESVAWDAYLSPQPIVPMAMGRGCYWRRCTFCPDYLHPRYQACRPEALGAWLESVAARFPGGAMVHLTDSALSPAVLERVAEIIHDRRLPLRWHGFARMEAAFAEPGFARHLAEGGCAMLQWGLETASPRLLELMGKGLTPERAAAVLRACADAGIRNHAYLLFGLPTESDGEREETLDFVRAEGASFHDLNAAILNLPRRSPMHRHPERYGITDLKPFGHGMDLSLYEDFRCGSSHPRLEARQWLGRRFLRDEAVKRILGGLNAPFKANHSCFLP